MLKYVFGGLGLTSIALSLQPFITTIQPYWLYFFFGGLFLFIFPLFLKFLRWVRKHTDKTRQKTNGPTIIRKGLITLGDLKWMVEYLNDATAIVEDIPFCEYHKARLIEHGTLFICPKRNRHCVDISKKDMPLLHNQAKSLVEADILRMIKNAKPT